MGRCLKGRAQNCNESVLSKVWSKKHKTEFCGLPSLQHAARTTVAEHNFSFKKVNVIAQLPFNKPSEQQKQTDHFHEASKTEWLSNLELQAKKEAAV